MNTTFHTLSTRLSSPYKQFLFLWTILTLIFLSCSSQQGFCTPSRIGLGRSPEQKRLDAFRERREVLTRLLGDDPLNLAGLTTKSDIDSFFSDLQSQPSTASSNDLLRQLGQTHSRLSNPFSWLPSPQQEAPTAAYRTAARPTYTDFKTQIETTPVTGLRTLLNHLQDTYVPRNSRQPLVVDLLRLQLQHNGPSSRELLRILFQLQVNKSWLHRITRTALTSGSVLALVEAAVQADQHYYFIQHGIASALIGGTIAAFTYYLNRNGRALSRKIEQTKLLLAYLTTDGYGSYLDGLFNLPKSTTTPSSSAQALIDHQTSINCSRSLSQAPSPEQDSNQ